MGNSTEYDTLEQRITNCISKALRHDEYMTLENNDEWQDLYIKLFMSFYIQLCELTRIYVIYHNNITIEPVTLHVDVARSKDDEPIVIHAISIYYLKKIFKQKNIFDVIQNTQLSTRLPAVFPLFNISDSISDDGVVSGSGSKVLSHKLSALIVQYYTFADHAAYHYHSLIQKKNADYTHECIKKRSNNLKSIDVKYIHDVVSRKPNSSIGTFVQPHAVLKVEDREHEKNYVNDNYRNIINEDCTDNSD